MSPVPESTPPAATLARIRHALLAWFAKERRDLPWRRTKDPYRILVSEVMLQQTRVETVIPYFERFVQRFPTPQALAAAAADDVLAHWAGLGYYRRARFLKAAAEAVVNEHGGNFPRTAQALRELPGIGRYTAGAVASIAFSERTPLVDGNVARVLSRLFRIGGDLRSKDTEQALWRIADALVPAMAPGDFNQALMELGAVVCTPATPRCGSCPVAKECQAFEHRVVERFPLPKKRRATIPVRLASCVIVDDSRIAVVRRAPGTRMAGLHDLPAVELAEDSDATVALSNLAQRLGLVVVDFERLGAAKHAITHHQIAIEVFRARLRRRTKPSRGSTATVNEPDRRIAAEPDPEGIVFVEAFALDGLGFSALGKKALRLARTPND